ncbi:MAG: hypothetical protein MRY21_01810 [Simkaniaceae bacterium]|nr:hypothetical protein [Simkaniaceae bacterium]
MDRVDIRDLTRSLTAVVDDPTKHLNQFLRPVSDQTRAAPPGLLLASLPFLGPRTESQERALCKLVSSYAQRYFEGHALDFANQYATLSIQSGRRGVSNEKIQSTFLQTVDALVWAPEYVSSRHAIAALNKQFHATYYMIPDTIDIGVRPNGITMTLQMNGAMGEQSIGAFAPLAAHLSDCADMDKFIYDPSHVFELQPEMADVASERLKTILDSADLAPEIRHIAMTLLSRTLSEGLRTEIDAECHKIGKMNLDPECNGIKVFLPNLHKILTQTQMTLWPERFQALKTEMCAKYSSQTDLVTTLFDHCLEYRHGHGNQSLFLRVLKDVQTYGTCQFLDSILWHEGEYEKMHERGLEASAIGLTNEEIDAIDATLRSSVAVSELTMKACQRQVANSDYAMQIYKRFYPLLDPTSTPSVRVLGKKWQVLQREMTAKRDVSRAKCDLPKTTDVRRPKTKRKGRKSRRGPPKAPAPPPPPTLERIAPTIRETGIRRTDQRIWLFDEDPDAAYHFKYGAEAPIGEEKALRIVACQVPYDILIKLAGSEYAKAFPFTKESGEVHKRYLIPGTWHGKACFFELTVDNEGTLYHCVAKTDFKNSVEYMSHMTLKTAHKRTAEEARLISAITIDETLTREVPNKTFEGLTVDVLGTISYGDARFFLWPKERATAGAGAGGHGAGPK